MRKKREFQQTKAAAAMPMKDVMEQLIKVTSQSEWRDKGLIRLMVKSALVNAAVEQRQVTTMQRTGALSQHERDRIMKALGDKRLSDLSESMKNAIVTKLVEQYRANVSGVGVIGGLSAAVTAMLGRVPAEEYEKSVREALFPQEAKGPTYQDLLYDVASIIYSKKWVNSDEAKNIAERQFARAVKERVDPTFVDLSATDVRWGQPLATPEIKIIINALKGRELTLRPNVAAAFEDYIVEACKVQSELGEGALRRELKKVLQADGAK